MSLAKCLICCKDVSPYTENLNGQREVCHRFCSLISRYFNLNVGDTSNYFEQLKLKTLSTKSYENLDNGNNSIVCCVVCLPTIESICQIYSHWANLQLRLNRSIELIGKLMKNSSVDFDCSDTSQVIGEFRKNLLKTVTAKPGPRNFPHLSMKKLGDIKMIKTEQQNPSGDQDETENYPVTTPATFSAESENNHHDDVNNHDDDEFDVDDPDYEPDAEENLFSSEKLKPGRQLKNKTQEKTKEVREDDNKTYSCHFCGKMFGLMAVLLFHQKKVHWKELSVPFQEIVSSGKIRLKCPSCPKTFTVRKNALHHFRMRHVNIPGEEKKPFKCDICGQAFGRRDALKQHGKVRHWCKCQFCKVSFSSQHALTFHLQKDHGKNKTKSVATKSRTKTNTSKFKKTTASRPLRNSTVAQINMKTDIDKDTNVATEMEHDHDPLEDISDITESSVSLVKYENNNVSNI